MTIKTIFARKGVTSVENKLKKNDMPDNQRIPLGPLPSTRNVPCQITKEFLCKKKKSETLAT